jgi:putative glycosyltransferase
MKLSIVTTLYDTSEFLSEFLRRSLNLVESLPFAKFEIIIVDDGSSEAQFSKARELCENYRGIKLIQLSKNFGHHQALLEGLKHTKGDVVFLIDGDLEEDPIDGAILYKEFEKTNADVVFGYQERRRGSIWEVFSGTLFYFILRKLMKVNIPENLMTSRIMSRRYVEALLSHTETQINFSGLSLITGFKQTKVPLKKVRHRRSTYTLSKKLSLLIDAVTSFSSTPLKLIFGVGFSIFTAATFVMFFLLIAWSRNGDSASGWASLMVSIWFLGGLIMLSLGVLGIYISRIFMETKKRPRAIVSEVFEFE